MRLVCKWCFLVMLGGFGWVVGCWRDGVNGMLWDCRGCTVSMGEGRPP